MLHNLISFINKLPNVDVWFFIICGVIIAAAIGVYFLIPVLNKKQYQEQRDNLRKREAAFKSNLTSPTGAPLIEALEEDDLPSEQPSEQPKE